jgi:WD40 repeat protein
VIVDVATGRIIHALDIRLGAYSDAERARFSADGRLVVTASEDGARIWSAGSGRRLRLLRARNVSDAFLSRDGKLLLTLRDSLLDRRAQLWNADSGQLLATWRARGAAFGPDSSLLAVAVDDDITRIVDTGTRRPLRTLRGSSPAFSPDGSRLLTIDGGAPQLWEVATGAHVTTLS